MIYDSKRLQAEFDEQREVTVRGLQSIIFSWDQNGHLMLRHDDISTLVSAVELLSRAQARDH